MKENELYKVCIWMWRWWSACNKANSGEKMTSNAEIVKSVYFYIQEFEKLGRTDSGAAHPRWKSPSIDVYKINVDASFYDSTKQGGWGFIVRDNEGTFLEGGARKIVRAANALQAEIIGAQKCLQHAADLEMTRIILETDAATLGKTLTSSCFDKNSNGCLFRQIREFIEFHFQYCY
ncbi:hypothetical protein U9M48_016145, partial [Paspalum notatum var. saurae]